MSFILWKTDPKLELVSKFVPGKILVHTWTETEKVAAKKDPIKVEKLDEPFQLLPKKCAEKSTPTSIERILSNIDTNTEVSSFFLSEIIQRKCVCLCACIVQI